MENKTKITLSKAQNGYVVGDSDAWGNFSNPLIFNSFEEAIAHVAVQFREKEFASTIRESQAMAKALANFCGAAVAPKLNAIEAKINPGIENVVAVEKSDDIPF